MKTSNIFNINIGLIAGHVLVCHMWSDTYVETPEAEGLGHGREVTRPSRSPSWVTQTL